MMSSDIPSEKKSCSGSALRLIKGKTAIEGRSAMESSFGSLCRGAVPG